MAKIYKYLKGEVHTLEVRETELMYLCDREQRCYEFRYVTRFKKVDCCKSREEALDKEKNRLLVKLKVLTDKSSKTNAEIGVLFKLIEEERQNDI